jgi:hypothetical protein
MLFAGRRFPAMVRFRIFIDSTHIDVNGRIALASDISSDSRDRSD